LINSTPNYNNNKNNYNNRDSNSNNVSKNNINNNINNNNNNGFESNIFDLENIYGSKLNVNIILFYFLFFF
jgi:hypothetical protein